jgi:cobalt-zinc-cadmium efflux system outer membrane protein
VNPQVKINHLKKFILRFIGVVFCLFLPTVNADTESYTVPPPPNILEQRVQLVEPQGTLSITEALSLALLHNPALQEFAWDIRIGDVKALRAGLLPNPELGVEVENFLGSGQRQDFQQTETTFVLSQLFELGGKRTKREDLANTERDLVIWDYESRRMDVVSQVAAAYIGVLASQARLTLANETTSLAEEIYNTVVARVKAGKVSPLEQNKSRVELARARLNKAKLNRELVTRKQNMAALWGSMEPLFNTVKGDLYVTRKIPDFPVLLPRLKNNPDLARWSAEIERYRKAITLAKAEKIPDLTIMAGARHFAVNDDFAAVAGASLPLFVFDNKQTGVDEANMILTQAMQKQQVVRIAVRSALVDNYQQLQMSQVEIEAFREEVLPSAKNALNAAKVAYRLGKIGSLDLLDSQRTLFQSNSQYLEALAAFHLNVAKIERLIGGALQP